LWTILQELGERPIKPGRPGVNPFILITNDVWSKCKEALGNSAGETRNEIRAEVGRQWREASDEVKRPYLEKCEAAQRLADEARAEYERKVAHWDLEARRIRLAYVRSNPPSIDGGSVWATGTSIEVPASRRKAAINYTELSDEE
jgi:lysine-specific histone demethylase 1